jgi:hypothetical protein
MIHLTPEMLVLAYALLRETPPYKAWKLPHPDDVAFAVSRTSDACGHFGVTEKGLPCIWISSAAVSRVDTLARIMAHEMLHLQQWVSKTDSSASHNTDFKQKARKVCQLHGFDPKLFV